jgi:hypothetical protein
MANVTPIYKSNESEHQPFAQRLVEIGLILLVFFIAAGDPPPHVNEAHYLCRLKHFWNPAWCAGDLFLESQDSQYVFIYAFGWVTSFLSLTATAWVGRVATWALLAYAWQRLSWRLIPQAFASVMSAALFVAINSTAQLAGEWVVGGVESKCVAYGFVLLALRELVDHRWNRLWLLLGAATAFHVLVGGWSMIVCAFLWLIDDRRTVPFRSMLPGIAGGGALALVGLVPAVLLTWNEPPELVGEAARIYVFERLPHHLAPLTLPEYEPARCIIRHTLLLVALWQIVRALRTTGDANGRDSRAELLAHFAWGAAILALVGFAIELALWNDPMAAARILRYYWFRLTDFAAPMAAAICGVLLISDGLRRLRSWSIPLLIIALVFAGWHLASKATARAVNPLPPADQKVRDLAAWDDACRWAAANTPADAVFLTPRLNHSFKWRAGRPEVVNRKDVPQDARSIVEWQRRIKEIYYADIEGQEQPLDSLGILGTERVRELAKKYGARYVLMDRGQLLSLPVVYWNEEYVIYRIDD